MSTRQVTVTYSGSTGLDIDEDAIVDALNIDLDLGIEPSDDVIEAAIVKDIEAYMEHGSDVQSVSHTYGYDRDELIESVRAAIARRRAEAQE